MPSLPNIPVRLDSRLGRSNGIVNFCANGETRIDGNACVLLIQQVISHKKIFAFGELLEIDSIAQLKESTEFQNAYNTLELFAYGTYSDYKNARDRYLQLNEFQMLKLKLLTAVTLCCAVNVVPYNVLKSELDMESVREIEDLVVEAMYNDLIVGQFNQQDQVFVVKRSEGLNGVFGRDVRPNDVSTLIAKLKNWRQKSAALCDVYETNTRELQSRRQLRDDEEVQLQSSITHMKEHVKSLFISHRGDDDVGDTKRMMSGYGLTNSTYRKRSRGPGHM